MNKGQRIAYGIGTAWYKREAGSIDRKLVEAIKTAIAVGYRHIDCAQVYNNEAECGVALSELDSSSVSRSDLFITTKFRPSRSANALDALRESLTKLKLKKVDLYLIHFPYYEQEPGHQRVEDMWRDMEKCHEAGLADYIGVSNYRVEHLRRTRAIASLPIYANQVELHPYHAQTEVLAYCHEHGIIVESYAPLLPLVHKTDGPIANLLKELADKYGRTEGQILMRWNQQKGTVLVTTSGKEERMKELLNFEDFDLSEKDVETIDKLGATLDFVKYER